MSHIGEMRRSISDLSLFLYSLAALLLQLGLLTYFNSIISTDHQIWMYTYKSFWALCLVVAISALALMPGLLARTGPALICACALSFFVFLTSYDNTAKNLIMSGIIFGLFIVLISAAGVHRCLQFCATLVAFSAIVILVDIQFPDGLSNTVGRAAGLYANPNIAGGALLIAAITSSNAVHDKYKVSFWILVTAAICLTLSRTTILCLVAVILVYLSSAIYLKRFNEVTSAAKDGVANIAITGLVVSALILSATITNPRFGLAFHAADLQMDSVNLSDSAEVYTADGDEHSESGQTSRHSKTGETSEERDTSSTDTRIKNTEKRSSADTRLLLFKRSFAAFLKHPLTGIGLKNSYQLRPHNTYLLFSVAYGAIGLVIPLAIVAFFLMGRTPTSIAMGVALVLILFFSHDVLLMPVYVIPITLAVASSLNQQRALNNAGTQRSLLPSQLALLVAASFVTWTHSIVASSSPKFIQRAVDPASMSEITTYSYYFDPLLFSKFYFYTLDKSKIEPWSMSHRIELIEDGKPLEWNPFPEAITNQRRDGQYAITHFGGIVFSASDGTNPSTSNHTYEVRYPVVVQPIIPILTALMIVWLIIQGLTDARNRAWLISITRKLRASL